MTQYIQPIMGARYRPPAKVILGIIPGETKMHLRAEPDNHFDPNAIAIYIKTDNIDGLAVEDNLAEFAQCGHDADSLRAQPEWHLGYIPKEVAQWMQSRLNGDHPCEYCFLADGRPAVKFDLD